MPTTHVTEGPLSHNGENAQGEAETPIDTGEVSFLALEVDKDENGITNVYILIFSHIGMTGLPMWERNPTDVGLSAHQCGKTKIRK